MIFYSTDVVNNGCAVIGYLDFCLTIGIQALQGEKPVCA